jgi:hypothetical protein
MKTNELKKGTRVQLRNGWYATLLDNKRGNIRDAMVEGFYTEAGSVYSHDIMQYQDANGKWNNVEHTESQLNCKKMNAALFG